MIWCLQSIMIVCSRWSKPAEIPTSSKTKPFFLNSQFFPSFFEIARPIRQLQSSFILCLTHTTNIFYSFKFILSPLFRCYLYGLNPPSFQSSLSFYFLDKCLQSVKMAVWNILTMALRYQAKYLFSIFKECFPSILK